MIYERAKIPPLQKDLLDGWEDCRMKIRNRVGADQCVCPDREPYVSLNIPPKPKTRANTQVRPYQADSPHERYDI